MSEGWERKLEDVIVTVGSIFGCLLLLGMLGMVAFSIVMAVRGG